MSPGVLAPATLLALPRGTRSRRELLPLLYAVLERGDRLGALGDEERALARRAYYTTLARSTALRDALLALLDDARAVGAPLLPLKGALLAFAVYPDPGMRPMGDLDVAVPPEHVGAVGARLEARGYRRWGAGRRRTRLDFTHQAIYQREDAPTVELHARLVHELGADGRLDGWWERAITVEALGRALPAPSWADHLFFVALHAATHAFADSPLWLFDLALVAERAGGAGLAEMARDRCCIAAIHEAFALARRLLPQVRWPAVDAPAGLALRRAVLDRALGDDPLARTPTPLRSLVARAALTDDPAALARDVAVKLRLRLVERFVERTDERG